MPHIVRKNRVTGKMGLFFEATPLPRGNIGKKGEINRSVLIVNGKHFHATKGFKSRRYWE